VEHLPYSVTAHFVRQGIQRGVEEIALGDVAGIRAGIEYGARLNQRLHA
jgi:putative transposase